MNTANDEQDQLLRYVKNFKSTTKPQDPELKELLKEVLNSARLHFLMEEKWYLNHLKAEYF